MMVTEVISGLAAVVCHMDDNLVCGPANVAALHQDECCVRGSSKGRVQQFVGCPVQK